MDTIYALASAAGKAGISVIRLSGPAAFDATRELAGSGLTERGMALRGLRNSDGVLLDQALVLTFPGPNSFTGEDVAEFQVHGSVAVIDSVLHSLSKINDLRPAEAGEFTRRALENGRLDLAQVEGLADLIDAETEQQRIQAQNVFVGKLGNLAEQWRISLIRAASLIEATIDFADEDVPVDVSPEVNELLDAVHSDLQTQINGSRISERIRDGFEIAIVGPPNVGKSTLLNALAGREAALTSEHAGTTRDVIEVRMNLAGLPVTFLDTAGLRETTDTVEGMGIALARKRAEQADLRVFLSENGDKLEITAQEDDIIVRPKADLRRQKEQAVSGVTGEGLNELIDGITEVLRNRTASAGLATRERHRTAMIRADQALLTAQDEVSKGPERYDIAAEELRQGIRALESLVGRVDVENFLDEIFASFCVGK
ncbi:tRNA uridine-5-carboxymethylaminomethyl(34) synthesis GTPase MnmE [Pontibaca salina]|uniref:tRNA modification GTPase MnmE n=1 Tax=Pontibaca salina TaxID=2795731 RepID=A0A934HJT9_9RHOB|nr:tRNA uridine-5-carboxymethylaminomethyl(34) synthesis GTPase MnmE [Pontibaca salina]MBI6629494.1 tRNA uridine-5-carboxymethylaminomethyl(34) synthesis GTPase MnmE [Pontibaca salina]